jgi:hypothetical protein
MSAVAFFFLISRFATIFVTFVCFVVRTFLPFEVSWRATARAVSPLRRSRCRAELPLHVFGCPFADEMTADDVSPRRARRSRRRSAMRLRSWFWGPVLAALLVTRRRVFAFFFLAALACVVTFAGNGLVNAQSRLLPPIWGVWDEDVESVADTAHESPDHTVLARLSAWQGPDGGGCRRRRGYGVRDG